LKELCEKIFVEQVAAYTDKGEWCKTPALTAALMPSGVGLNCSTSRLLIDLYDEPLRDELH
jgi:hypothetical protein